MNPLHLRILMGHEDDRLLVHIAAMEKMAAFGGLSPNEEFTRRALWERLDMITTPR